MFIAALITIAKTWIQSKHLSIGEWMNKWPHTYTMYPTVQIYGIYTTEYISTIKSNKLLIHTITRMNLKGILSKISHTQKTIYCIIPFIWHSRKGKTTRTEIWPLAARAGKEERETKKRHKGTFWSDENILHFDCDGGDKRVYIHSRSQNYTPKRVAFYCV